MHMRFVLSCKFPNVYLIVSSKCGFISGIVTDRSLIYILLRLFILFYGLLRALSKRILDVNRCISLPELIMSLLRAIHS